MFSFKVSSLTLSLVLSPFLVFPAVAGGIAQNSGGAPSPGDNTVFSNPASVIFSPTTTTSVQGATVTINNGVANLTVPPLVSQNLSQAAGLVIAALQTANTPAAQAILNNLGTNLGVGGVASTSQTIVEGIVITNNEGGVQGTPATLNSYGQALAAVRAILAAGFSPGSSVQLQVGTRVVTLSPL